MRWQMELFTRQFVSLCELFERRDADVAHDRNDQNDDTMDLSEVVQICKNVQKPRPSAQSSAPVRPTRPSNQPSHRPAHSADLEDLWDFDEDFPDRGQPTLFDDAAPQPAAKRTRAHVFDFDLQAPAGPVQPPHNAPVSAGGSWSTQCAPYDAGMAADETELEDEDAYDWAPLPQDAEDDAMQHGNAYGSSQPRKRKRKRKFLRFLLVLLILLILTVTAVVVFAKAPERNTEGLGSRVGDTVNVLIAGTDQAIVQLSSFHGLSHRQRIVVIPVKDRLYVSWAYAKSRMPAGIGGFHHSGPAGSDDHVAVLH